MLPLDCQEGNHAPLDSSSTEMYQRDSWSHFARFVVLLLHSSCPVQRERHCSNAKVLSCGEHVSRSFVSPSTSCNAPSSSNSEGEVPSTLQCFCSCPTHVSGCRYWARHTIRAWISVPLYAHSKGRQDLMLECLAGELLYLASLAFVCWRNPVAALWVFIVPFLLTSFAIMFGNW